MRENQRPDPLTALLRAGDPAAEDAGLDPQERALMRQRMLAAGGARRLTDGWLVPAVAAMALLALALGLPLRQAQTPLSEAVVERPRAAAASSSGQQIQFTTDSGILVVWVLQPRQSS